MELFNEFLSGRLQAVIDLMLAGARGRVLTRQEVTALLTRNHILENCYDVIRSLMDLGILTQVEKDRFCLAEEVAVGQPPAPPLSLLEEDYLAYALSQPEADWFLGERRAGGPSPLSCIQAVRGGDQAPPIPSEMARVLTQAIVKRYTLRYTYRTRDNPTPRQDEQIPFRLEYHVFDRRWWLILYLQEQERTVKVKLEHIQAASLGRPHQVTDEAIQAVIRRRYLHPEPVRLLIRDERNAVERAFLTLGHNPDLTASRQPDGSVMVRFSWFSYDLEEIVKKLMYLGDAVQVLGPPDLCGRLAQRLRTALAVRQGEQIEA